MTDSNTTGDNPGTSRRTLLKGAVGAGVGLAAWSAPKIGTIPAYALTNSSGTFNGVCYYFLWDDSAKAWRTGGPGGGAGNVTGRADSFVTNGDVTDRTFTWNSVFAGGEDLIVRAAGDPEAGAATISLITPPVGCEFEQLSATLYEDRPGSMPEPTAADCVTSLTPTSGTVALGATSGTISGVTVNPAESQHFLVFNVDCS